LNHIYRNKRNSIFWRIESTWCNWFQW